MATEGIQKSGATLKVEAIEEMAKYGITLARTDYFCYGGFRYTNLEDAIAEAKRHPRSIESL